MSARNIQVAIKVRPIEPNQSNKWEVLGNSIQLVDSTAEPYYFDQIFDQDANNQVIFDSIAKQIVSAGVKGFNGTIFAYGQTSSGKTYTMMGDETNPGVMVLAAKKIFEEIECTTDWQFLLRVSYIEIYNEKIYDLLNRTNQELKVHENNGEVGVNCSEFIITCEEDLLSHLRDGSKQRKIGETAMNERSSRSHAIFRIIIESRKIDKTDDDSVQISSLTFVDLAGSERSDQTGATGSRLKEGNHINKSLFFLSRVIKQLAEGKFASYRDSKLTRILQASLGGNALTTIICTINPTAVDETQSTLSFANRAKVVKNKPQVNEVLTDAAMMKKLVKKIDRLTNELEVEKSKNSQIKVGQLQKLLNDEIHKIININAFGQFKESSKNRRRTWCPSSMIPPLVEEESAKTEMFVPLKTTAPLMPTKLQLPKCGINFTPLITVRDQYYQSQVKEMECSPSIDEEFIPGEEVCFDDIRTPQTSPLKMCLKTPNDNVLLRASLTPKLSEKESLQKVQQEFMELEDFTNLENKLNVEHDIYNTLKHKLQNAERIIANYEKEREEFAFIKIEHVETVANLTSCLKRSQELESKVTELENASERSAQQINRYEKEITELKAKLIQLEMENRSAVGLEFEFEQHKNKSKRREKELLEALDEKRKEINKLERSLQTVTTDMLNNSKEELQQASRNLNESDSNCNKCKDFQRILNGQKQLIEDFEKITTENRTLHLNIEKVSSQAESEKLRADSLETEICSLKKDTDHLKSLHGSIEEIQSQITALQAEKCKLESIKIEFEVMSKETAKKLAEKISITQEIETLNTQRDNLAAECDKLLADISSKEDLNKIRLENDSLHAELEIIKTKLESAQLDYAKLTIENQSKSDNYEKLNMEVLSARNQLQTLQSDYSDIQQKYEQIQVECNKHEGTIDGIQSEYNTIHQKYQNLQKEYEKLENDSVQSFADCDRIQTQNKNLETEIHELKTKVEEAQRKLLENDSLQVELESLKSEMYRLQEEYDTKKSISPKKEHNNVDLSQENSKLRKDLESLQQKYNDLQKEYDDTSTQLFENLSDYESLQNEMASLQEEFQRYKNTSVFENLAEDFKAMKVEIVNLEAKNSQLIKDNEEWKNTVESMTKSMTEKCQQAVELAAQLEDSKSEASLKTCIEFNQLAESFVEIEIPTENGSSKVFQAVGTSKTSHGTRMIIGSINELTEGTFNELRGTIQFAISSNVHKSCNEMYDSLEMEDNSTSPNSCDSLEVPMKLASESQVNELLEEKACLFEKIRDLENTISTLKNQNLNLTNSQKQLEETRSIVEQLNSEKNNLITICEENKCKIKELCDIISRTECDNTKLIADCQKLKKTVESGCAVESVPQETYEELKRQLEECKQCYSNTMTCNKCTEVENEISKLKGLNESKVNGICKCAELQAELDKQTEKLQKIQNEYDQEVNALLEQLKQKDSTCQQVKNEIESLRSSLNEKTQETIVVARKFEELNEMFTKLEADHDELLGSERMKSVLLEKSTESIKTLEAESKLLESSVVSLKDSIALQANEIQNLRQEKEKMEIDNQALKNSESSLHAQLEKLLEEHEIIVNDKERLQKEYHSNVNEIERLKKERDLINDESEELKKQCEELVNNLDSTATDTSKLQAELIELKKQKEELKECHIKERTLLEDKCTLLSKEIDDLNSTKSDLEMAMQKAKEQSEFLLQQGKDIESELIAVRNSNSSMIQQIEFLTQKLEKSEIDLREANEKLSSEENERIKNLTAINNELKAEKSVIEEQLTESKQSLMKEVESKKILEKEFADKNCEIEMQFKALEEKLVESSKTILKKEETIAHLTSENNSLVTTNLQLKDRLKELVERLENDCLEKNKLNEDLLTKNNSLNKEISELKERLVQIENQFEESKKCMSLDIESREAIHKESLEKDKIIAKLAADKSTLANKNSELENSLKKMHEKVESELSERDSLTAHNCELKEKLTQVEGKLIKTEEDLKKLSLEKDELIGKLTAENNALIKTNSEIVEKISTLERLCEESKQQKHDLEKEFSEKIEVNTKLSNENYFLTNKSSELEKKLESLEKQLQDLNRCLSTDGQMKEALERKCIEKDEIIAELSNKNKNLLTKSALLEEEFEKIEKELKETKFNLSTEKHATVVLEKANTERDNLIIQLTNNNNSLSTKNSEVEEKLAILANQFEESKKHFSTETVKLNQLLKETTLTSTSQSSKIIDLTTKIKDLESELTTAQSEAKEKDVFLQKYNQLKSEYDNLMLSNETLKEEIKSAQDFVEKNSGLSIKLNELQGKLNEIQFKCNSLSASNIELEMKNKSLAKSLEDALKNAANCNKFKSEIVILRGDFEKSQKDLLKFKEEQKEWEIKEHSFVEKISQLQTNVTSLIAEKESLQKNFESSAKTSLQKISQLEQQIQALQKDQSLNVSKTISPPRREKDHLMSEPLQSKVKNMSIMDKLDSCQRSQNEERKNRRLSTHDERRLLSFWDSNRDVSTMTDPTSSECSCLEMDHKLNEMKQRLLIRDSQVNTLSMELKNHPLKAETAALKKLLIEEESKQQQLRQEIKKYKQLIVNKTNESRHCAKCAEASKKIFVDSFTQSTESDENECYRKLLSKYEDLKMICRGRHIKIRELEDALSNGKENAKENFSSLHNQQFKQKYDHLKKEMKLLQEKYEEAKLICNMRYEQIKNFTSQQQTNS